ncbi:MAG: hypothetical protein AAGA48_01880 [Myxococcota bacterium]
MNWRTASVGLSIACSLHEDPVLLIEGPDHIQVHELGPVDGPTLRLSDGSKPMGLRLLVPRREVAEVRPEYIVARGPGRTPVVARWRGQEVTWTLEVDLVTELRVTGVPSSLRPGDTARLDLSAVRSGRSVAVGEVTWVSSDPTVLQVQEGQIQAIRPGLAFVTAQTSGAAAMIELAVINEHR